MSVLCVMKSSDSDIYVHGAQIVVILLILARAL